MAPSAIAAERTVSQDFVNTDDLRTSFALAMSAMYKKEVPLYGDLVRIVRSVNNETIANSTDPAVSALRNGQVENERLDLERHGAIRLGTPSELRNVRRIFAIIGLHPVGYYDLSEAGLPMHATCFRPITTKALRKNPFRVFTTLLRPELLKDAAAKGVADALLQRRQIFSPELLILLDEAERQKGRLRPNQAIEFVKHAVATFGWRPVAAASKAEYDHLKQEHPILADISCFDSAHINHLTPRTLDIDAAQGRMKAEGLRVKDRIEGPPRRHCPILLRQTSFLALEESIMFQDAAGKLSNGSHKARFGEIEERGAAVTRKGRELYDCLLGEAMAKASRETEVAAQDHIFAEAFASYPDTWEDLRRQGLVFFSYRCTVQADLRVKSTTCTREELVADGTLEAIPITYEDFLPMSAAGIFQSNLQAGGRKTAAATERRAAGDVSGYERALGIPVMDLDQSYAEVQEESLKACARELGMPELTLLA